MCLPYPSNLRAAILLAAAVGCGPAPPPGTAIDTLPPGPCGSLGSATLADTVKVALFERVDPGRAPVPRNAGERLVFGQLYETLFVVDCSGETRGGLAETAVLSSDGRTLTVRLRDEVRFWDGTRVTAGDVAACWSGALAREAGIDSALVVDERRLELRFARPHPGPPALLAAPAYSITKPGTSGWPVGTGPYRVIESPARSSLVIEHIGADGPVIRFVAASPANARDRLESSVDVMVTDDDDAIEYASAQPRFEVAALAWSDTYVLVSTSRLRAALAGRPAADWPRSVNDTLARNAVRASARSSEGPWWWNRADSCGALGAVPSNLVPEPLAWRASSGPKRILYAASDPTARDLAERLVAVARADTSSTAFARAVRAALPGLSDGGKDVVAAGVGGDDFWSRLSSGEEYACVLSLPRDPADPCGAARALVRAVPWLADRRARPAHAVVPLVDTRAHVIAVRGRVKLESDRFGNVRVVARTRGADAP